jgi:hypothetical protein
VCYSVFHIYVGRRKNQIKHKSADMIRQFFKEVHDVSKLMKVVKKYRFSGMLLVLLDVIGLFINMHIYNSGKGSEFLTSIFEY